MIKEEDLWDLSDKEWVAECVCACARVPVACVHESVCIYRENTFVQLLCSSTLRDRQNKHMFSELQGRNTLNHSFLTQAISSLTICPVRKVQVKIKLSTPSSTLWAFYTLCAVKIRIHNLGTKWSWSIQLHAKASFTIVKAPSCAETKDNHVNHPEGGEIPGRDRRRNLLNKKQ
jgi:hypothetical protein